MEEKKKISIYEALVQIQSRLKAPKDLVNKFGGYKYRSAESILEALKPLLNEFGCYLTISDSVELIGDRFYIKSTATLSDGVDSIVNTAYAREELSKKGMDASQITGATSSYCRKYCLNGLFLIDDTKDADSDEYTARANGQQAPTPQQKQPQDGILGIISQAKSVAELQTIWNSHKDMQKDQSFKTAVSQRKHELTDAQS